MADSAASYEGVLDAARQIAPAAVRTPLIEHPALNERVGGRVLLKAETLQVAGSFKFRGAYNRISRLTEDEKAKGVVAYSSGNHAQGVAEAMRFAFRWLKLVVEPGGAVSLAALLAGKIPAEERTTVVMLTGGNVDPALFAAIIENRFPGDPS